MRHIPLPGIEVFKYSIILNKTGACDFYSLYQISQRNRGMKMSYNMQMIFHTLNPVQMTVAFI